jgi:hypothetical protein
MGAARMVQQWTVAVNNFFCSLHGHTVNSLSCFSFAMCLASHCHAGKLAAAAVADAKPASSRRRWERLLANDRLDGRQAMEELAASLLKDSSGRSLLMVLDETPNGQDLRCMRLGLAYRKRLLSLAAPCYPTDQPPLPMPKLICQMLRDVAKLLPPDVRHVTLLCDRGLSWPAVMDCVRGLGWGHVMRLQHATRVTLADGQIVTAGDLVRRRGQHWSGRRVRIFKKAGWRDASLSVCWDPRSKEPWILAARSDGGDPGGLHAAQAYAKRNWCEQTFRDEKSNGFRWADSHVRDPQRAQRLVLVMVLATLLAISLGTWLLKRGLRHDLDPHRHRRLSVFQLGLRWLHHLLVLTDDDGYAMPAYLPYLPPS